MIENVRKTIKKHRLICESDHVVVALSGGADSVFTLICLNDLKEDMGFTLSACHFNHMMRGKYADRDENFAVNLCRSLGLECSVKRGDMLKTAREKGLSPEDAGRRLRMEFFDELCAKSSNVKIATGHNANDRAETLVQRLVRGTGLRGLRSIEYKNGNIVRPILDVKRDDIELFLEKRGVEFMHDHTNDDIAFGRNFVRHVIMPKFKKLNPKVEESLNRLSDIAGDVLGFVDDEVRKLYAEISRKSEKKITLDIIKLKEAHDYIKASIIAEAIIELKSEYDISSTDIKRVLKLLNSRSGKMETLSGGITAEASYDKIIFSLEKSKKSYKEYSLFEGLNELETGLEIEIREVKDVKKFKGGCYLSGIKFPLNARSRRSGDRIKPMGMKGFKKIKDVFIDKKIPRDLRDDYIVIESDGEIAAVLGLIISEDFKADEKSKIYSVSWRRKKDDRGY